MNESGDLVDDFGDGIFVRGGRLNLCSIYFSSR